MQPLHKTPILPEELREALSAIGAKLERRQSVVSEIARVSHLLSNLPATTSIKVERQISSAAKLHHYGERQKLLSPAWFSSYRDDAGQLEHAPGLEYLFVFHMDGRLREAALNKIMGGIPGPFLLSAIAWRLNDWVLPVRIAATECFKRTFPLTSADVITQAAMVLIPRQKNWGRWTDERSILFEAFKRPDVAAALAKAIQEKQAGSALPVLLQVLQSNGLDPFLETLAKKAKQPAVRAIALQALIDSCASWPSGFGWQWIDKSMGLRKRLRAFGRRPFEPALSRRAAIFMGIADGSATVKKVALDALTHYRAEMPDAREIALPLLKHRAASVRERAEFLLSVVDGAEGCQSGSQ